MRDPERIKRMCAFFEQAWLAHPDWRMGQLLSNLQGPGAHDVFFMEDDEMEKLLRAELKKVGIGVGDIS